MTSMTRKHTAQAASDSEYRCSSTSSAANTTIMFTGNRAQDNDSTSISVMLLIRVIYPSLDRIIINVTSANILLTTGRR